MKTQLNTKDDLITLALLINTNKKECFDLVSALASRLIENKMNNEKNFDQYFEFKRGLTKILSKLSSSLSEETGIDYKDVKSVLDTLDIISEEDTFYSRFIKKRIDLIGFGYANTLFVEKLLDNLIKLLFSEVIYDDEEILNPRESKIIALYEGLGDYHSSNIEEISKVLKMNRERALQIKEIASLKLWKEAHKFDISYSRT